MTTTKDFVPCSVVSSVNFGVFYELSTGNLFLNVVDCSKMVVDAIDFAFPWLPCRMRDTKSQLIIGEAFHQHFNQSTFSDFGIQEDVLCKRRRVNACMKCCQSVSIAFPHLPPLGPQKTTGLKELLSLDIFTFEGCKISKTVAIIQDEKRTSPTMRRSPRRRDMICRRVTQNDRLFRYRYECRCHTVRNDVGRRTFRRTFQKQPMIEKPNPTHNGG